jgi:serine/threonine protein kinase
MFMACVGEESISADRANADLVASLQRLKKQNAECTGPKPEWKGCKLARGNSIVVFTKDSEDRLTATKTSEASGMDILLQREIKILKMMNHPLVVRINERCSEANNQHQTVVTDFVANGSLADHLLDAETGDLCQLRG